MNSLKLPEITLLGIKLPFQTTNENGQSMKDCGALWQQFQTNDLVSKIPNKLNEQVYAVYYGYKGDHTQPYSYFIGCPVEESSEVPADLVKLHIPQDSYLKKTASGKMPDCVANAWLEIWKSELNRSYHFDFEIYDHRSQNWDQSEVDIYLSVK